ncbi:MAG: NAD-dependent dehydratase, partial [Gammaproteobacteria bacterium]
AGLSLSTHGYVANLAHSVLLAADKPEESAGQIYNCGDETQYTMSQIIEVVAAKMNHKFELINMPYELALPARAYVTGPSTHHRLMDISKIKSQLDYRDVNPVDEALGLTVDWLLENRPAPGGDLEERLQDPFNYEGEDRIIEAWQQSLEKVAQVPFEIASHRPHPYAHPKKPGERDHRNR